MPCTEISVVSKTRFQGDFNIETLKQALLSIPGVMMVKLMASDTLQVSLNIIGQLQTVEIRVDKKQLYINGLGSSYLEKKVAQHYNALVQAQMLRRMGFNTKVEVRGENIMVQAVK